MNGKPWDSPAPAGASNSDHFLIATQDRSLQRKAMAVPGGAVVFASVNGVHLETPSDLQKQKVKQVRGTEERMQGCRVSCRMDSKCMSRKSSG